MSKALVRVLFCCLTMLCLAGSLCAKETRLPCQLHPWALFDPGAWKVVHVVTENIDEHGKVTQLTNSTTKTTLLDVDDDGVTLQMEDSVEMAGKRFDTPPKKVKQAFSGDPQTAVLKISPPTDVDLAIEDRKFSCQLQEIESTNQHNKTVSKIYFSKARSPYVLKRESVTTDLEGKTVLSQTDVSVQDFDMPCQVLGHIKNGIYVKTVQKTPQGVSITLAVICPDVPGGTISHSCKELDSSGRLIRRSTLELVDYNTRPEKDHAPSFRKRRARSR